MEYDRVFYSEIMDNINIGIFVLDVAGNYLYVNDAYCQMTYKPTTWYKDMSIPKLKELGNMTGGAWKKSYRQNVRLRHLLVRDRDMDDVYQLFCSGTPTFNSDGA